MSVIRKLHLSLPTTSEAARASLAEHVERWAEEVDELEECLNSPDLDLLSLVDEAVDVIYRTFELAAHLGVDAATMAEYQRLKSTLRERSPKNRDKTMERSILSMLLEGSAVPTVLL